MKICLIKASADTDFKEYKASMGGPPQNIFAAAAATPKDIDIEMVDETIGKKINLKTDADLIAIFFSTPDAMRGYKLAEMFRQKGKKVVLGGLHPTMMPEEASKYADAVFVGEIENYWTDLIEDCKKGQLKPKYQSKECVELADLHPYPTDILTPKDYRGVWSVVVGRGCDNACTYCVVNPFFKKYRFRPIPDIVEEIKQSGAKIIELHADNLIAERDYALALFKAIKPLNIRWIGECTITVAEDDELLKAMVESGLSDLLVGLETPDQEALDNIGKSFIKVDKLKGYVSKIQSLGVDIDASFLFGFDEHKKDIFDKTLAFALDVKIAKCHSVILTPFPGTPFYKQIESENRLLTREYTKFDCTHAVFKPKNFSALDLERGALWFDEQFERAKAGKSVTSFWEDKKTPVRKSSPAQNELPQSKRSPRGPEMPSIDDVKVKTGYQVKWKALIGLTMVLAATVFNLPWLFGILYLTWAIQDLQSGYAFILEDVSKRDNPILFWLTVSIWLLGGLYVLTEPIITKLILMQYM